MICTEVIGYFKGQMREKGVNDGRLSRVKEVKITKGGKISWSGFANCFLLKLGPPLATEGGRQGPHLQVLAEIVDSFGSLDFPQAGTVRSVGPF